MLLTSPDFLYRSICVARQLSEEKGTGKEVSVDDRITGGSEDSRSIKEPHSLAAVAALKPLSISTRGRLHPEERVIMLRK